MQGVKQELQLFTNIIVNFARKETKNKNILKPKEIKEKYTIGTKVIDCYGNPDTIRHNRLETSDFKPVGTLVLGGVWIYDSVEKRWATIEN